MTKSTFGVYRVGVGMTITHANIDQHQKELAERGHNRASASEIVKAFTGLSESNDLDHSKRRYKRLLHRAQTLMIGAR